MLAQDQPLEYAQPQASFAQQFPGVYKGWKACSMCKFVTIVITLLLLAGITIATASAKVSLTCCMPDVCQRSHFGQVKSKDVITRNDGSCYVDPSKVGSGGTAGAIASATGQSADQTLCLNSLESFRVNTTTCQQKCKDKGGVNTSGNAYVAVLAVILGIIGLQCLTCSCDFFIVRKNDDDVWNNRASPLPIILTIFFIVVGIAVTVVTFSIIAATTKGYVDADPIDCGQKIKVLVAKTSDPVVGMAAVSGILSFVGLVALILAFCLMKYPTVVGAKKKKQQSDSDVDGEEYYPEANPYTYRAPQPSPMVESAQYGQPIPHPYAYYTNAPLPPPAQMVPAPVNYGYFGPVNGPLSAKF